MNNLFIMYCHYNYIEKEMMTYINFPIVVYHYVCVVYYHVLYVSLRVYCLLPCVICITTCVLFTTMCYMYHYVCVVYYHVLYVSLRVCCLLPCVICYCVFYSHGISYSTYVGRNCQKLYLLFVYLLSEAFIGSACMMFFPISLRDEYNRIK
jgi:hypothetical protein